MSIIRRSIFLLMASLVFTVLGQASVFANHSFAISESSVCNNGALITGTSTAADSLNLLMLSQVINTTTLDVLATGSSYTYAAVGETFVFTVTYPVGTLPVGQVVYLSITDVPGTVNGTEGAFELGTVADCVLPFFPDDDRINRRDEAAPIAVYARNAGLEIYTINRDSSGQLAFSVTAAEIAAVGVPASRTLIVAQGGITVSRDPDGQFVMTAPMYNGKTYVLFFEFVGSLTPYWSYEVG